VTLESTPFFIVGADRSGTTMLRLMINEHPALHVPRESWFLIDLMNELPLDSPLSERQVRRAFDIITTRFRWKDWDWKDWEVEHANRELWDRLAPLHEPCLSDLIDAAFSLSSERSGKYRWGDKTPEYVKEIDRLHTVFPRARFIHIIRDGRDTHLSLMFWGIRSRNYSEMWGLRSRAFFENAKHWADPVAAGIESGRRLPRGLYLEIAYEDVVLKTEQTLGKVCQFLDVPYSPKMLEFYKNAGETLSGWEQKIHYKTFRPPSSDDVFKWRREMNMLDLIAFEAIAGCTMDKANQVREFSGIYRIVPVAFTVLNKVAKWSLPILRKVRIPFRR
jgi:Sulfotransferase family